MAKIREAVAEDFAQVHPLLLEFENPNLGREDWRQLFVDHSGCQGGRFGYVLVEGDRVVGFLALTFSERLVRGERRRLCNLSNWIVKSEHRGQSLALLTRVLALRGVTITNLSPTPEVYRMCERLGFLPLDRSERIVLPLPDPRGLFESCRILTDPARIEPELDPETRKICRDHRLPHHRHMLVRSRRGECYLMLNRSRKQVGRLRLPLARVHYASAPDVLLAHLGRIAVTAALRFGTVAMVLDERILGGHRPWQSFARPGGPRRGAYRPDGDVRPEEIDGLYSELVLLNY